jgi:uncharacterized oxidoreductase
MNVEHNTVLITGGGTGIGLGLARALARLNNRVLICGRRRDVLEAAKKEVPELNIFACDISRDDERERLLAHIRENFPKINMLINNAAVMHQYFFADGSERQNEIEQEIGINLTAPLQLTVQLLPALKANRAPAVVNITSAIARVIHEPSVVYCASKAGLSMASKVLRHQLKKDGVRVFEVIPPPVDTQMCQGARHKLSIDGLVAETIGALRRDQYEIRAGRTKLYYWLEGISPWIAKKVIGRV